MNTIKERIIQEAAGLFATRGCKVITMDEIATSMGISKRTIYENFSDKRELLLQCVEYFFRQAQNSVDTILKSSDNVIDTIFKTMTCRSDFIRQAKDNFFHEIQKYFPDVYKSTVITYKERNLENTEKLLKKGQEDKVIKKDIDIKLTATLLQEIGTLMVGSDMFTKYGYDKHTLMSTFMYTFTRGLCTEKGLKILDELKNTK
ncbi:MAG: TetR/AcrR family transcriptional regulator [Prevotellaceae bacterium]|jgi:AcrR family transcriptional regulator|nr:TetR/AcrR family transcriptional regulator [Prevotellaceae bacterium]